MSTLILFLLVVCSIDNAAGACTFPSDLRGTWVSSDSGSLTFNSSHVADYTVYNQGTITFACESLVGSYYILKSEEFTLFSSPAIAVMCISFTSLKESLYKYQIHTSMLQDAGYQRIRFVATGTTVDSSLACTDLGSSDYYLLMADGQISAVKEQCPDIFLGTFGFSFNDSDCTNNTGSLDVCTDLNTMTFNYSVCSTVQAYSSGGSLNCLYSSTTGDVTTLNVYNLDSTTDESTTFRFTCYVIEQTSGSSNVYATQYPKDCHVNQTSTYVPGPGANLTMLASVTCVPTSTTEATSVSQASLFAGVAAGLFVLLLLVLLIVCFYCYKKKSKIQPAGMAPIDTAMPYQKEKEDLGDLELEEAHSEVPPRSTEAEPPTAIGHSRKDDNTDGPRGALERQMSKEITIHFRDLKELELMKERAKMQTLVDECPITKEKDHHWTPTFDGSVRPRLELTYVEPTDYKDVVNQLHPNGNVANGHVTHGQPSGIAMHTPSNNLMTQPVFEQDEDEYESEDDDNLFISPSDTNAGTETKSKPKKKKKKKKKKHVQIKDNK
ncbi:uncharacterized protein LOC110440401 [Mizuhopecten yessoensis]|uniref:DUF7042 domain-containing protein n=1 Tax=Mizuhopecten yessoensis TaxID=6573 RepID=A0A210PL87_MIZYE|nr:uncharacterized protein LOC110440401 [Mizuhopecten yessoensis]OWF37249.1 hypothetical protein KP79_PYT12411 [Mizuhopecten yessoensis]